MSYSYKRKTPPTRSELLQYAKSTLSRTSSEIDDLLMTAKTTHKKPNASSLTFLSLLSATGYVASCIDKKDMTNGLQEIVKKIDEALNLRLTLA